MRAILHVSRLIMPGSERTHTRAHTQVRPIVRTLNYDRVSALINLRILPSAYPVARIETDVQYNFKMEEKKR